MKKITLLLITLLIVSCKSTSNKGTTTEFNLSDSWLLKKISFVDPNMYDKIILFDDATNQCFKESLWKFNATSDDGSYAINDLYCSYGKRNLSFRYLKTEEKTGYSHIVLKAQNKAGISNNYRIKITELSNTSMQWHYVVYVKNKRHTIYMQFERV